MHNSPRVRARPLPSPRRPPADEGGSSSDDDGVVKKRGGQRFATRGVLLMLGLAFVVAVTGFVLINGKNLRLKGSDAAHLDSTPLELAALSAILHPKHGGVWQKPPQARSAGGSEAQRRVLGAGLLAVGTGTGDDDLDELDELLRLHDVAPSDSPIANLPPDHPSTMTRRSVASVNAWDTLSTLLSRAYMKKLKGGGGRKMGGGNKRRLGKGKGKRGRMSKPKSDVALETSGDQVLVETEEGIHTGAEATKQSTMQGSDQGLSNGERGVVGESALSKGAAEEQGGVVPEETEGGVASEGLTTLGSIDAAALVAELPVPGGAGWARAQVSRLVLSQQQPHLKGLLKRTRMEALPEKDYEKRFAMCAVVGNGGGLLLDELGGAIDRHEAVFRFNDGPTAGFEKHVGKRTSFRVLNNNWAHKREEQSRRPPGAEEEEAILLFGRASARSVAAIAKQSPSTAVYFMAPEFSAAARTAYKTAQQKLQKQGAVEVSGRNSAPTGVEGIFFALQVCGKVHLYGFGATPNAPYHYHDQVQGVQEAHSFGFQDMFLNLLAQAGLFEICSPRTELQSCRMLSSELSTGASSVGTF